MYKIVKAFKADLAHRIPNQDLNQYCGTKCELENKEEKCKRIHGHTIKIEVCLSSMILGSDSMVVDFNYMKWFKDWVDRTLDHKFIGNMNDEKSMKLSELWPGDVTLFGFDPTAEELSHYIYIFWQKFLQENNIPVKLEWIRVWETETAYAEYSE